MSELQQLLQNILTEMMIDMVLSGTRNQSDMKKIKIRPVMMKDELYFQATKTIGTQVFHENFTKEQMISPLLAWISQDFKQAQIRMKDRQFTILVSKKGHITIKEKQIQSEKKSDLTHNRSKKYILEEGMHIPFMIDLGVMTVDGKIIRTKYDKYRQMNRFLEFIEDILPELPKDRKLTIIDFGCGKSYLTFAMYYYLKVLKGLDIQIIGLDLKKQVIEHCQKLANAYGYDELQFLCGDIAEFEGVDAVDMVVTLHACDTATDFALAKAVKWHAGVVLSVPCCQHELNRQMKCDTLNGAFQYGLIQERTAALMTDALRGQLLELAGYKTQILEFIDMSHTPKNILIRAVKNKKMQPQALMLQKQQQYDTMRDFLGVHPTLEKLLFGEKGRGQHE